MKPWFSLLMIVALTLAACAPTPIPSDWCYVYDFAVAAETSAGSPINIISGSWAAGAGIRSTLDGELVANYTETFFMHPSQISIVVGRGESVTGPVDVSVIANFFGAQMGGSGTIPDDVADVTITIDNNESELVEGNTVNATAQASDQIVIRSITVRGDGVNPFPRNDCAPQIDTPTPSPQPVTPNPTATHTGTATSTPTVTATPTGGGDCWVTQWDFAVSNPLSIPNSRGEYVAGVGYRDKLLNFGGGGGWRRNLYLSLPVITSPVTITGFEMIHTATAGTNWATSIPRQTTIIFNSTIMANIPMGDPIVLYPNQAERIIGFQSVIGTAPQYVDPGGHMTVTGFVIWGTGASPSAQWPSQRYWCNDLTPTPLPPTVTNTPNATPTATRTPSPTRTPLPSQIPPTATRTLIPSVTPRPPTSTPTNPVPWTHTFTPPPTNTPAPTKTPLPSSTPLVLPTDPSLTVTPWITLVSPNFGGTPSGTVTPGATYISPDDIEATSINTPDAFEQFHGDAVNSLSTAVAGLNSLPADFAGVAPGVGVGLGTFAPYAKGFISGVNLQELVGIRLYPILQHIFYAFSVVLMVVGGQIVVKLVLVVIRFVYWFVRLILKAIPFFG